MRRTRKQVNYRAPVVCAAIFLLGMLSASASTRPHYGGTVRVLLQHKVSSLDPTVETEYPADRDKLSALVFETLTEIDSQGQLHPKLAASWQPDSSQRVWQFQLRVANFHDGTAMTSAAVVAALKAVAPDWKITPNGKQGFTLETPAAIPYLPQLLSLPRFAIVKRLGDGTLSGTGPYKLSEWQSGDHAVFVTNEEYWGGRAYPDAIDVQMGASLREHLLERNLGRDHAAEVSIDQLHALEQTTQNLLLSRPSDLLVIVFAGGDNHTGSPTPTGRKSIDPKLRLALAAALNRNAISNVLLQRKSAAATAVLPQWLTGYEFMFMNDASGNPEQARAARAEAGGNGFLTLAYDFSDPVLKAVADRIAVDAREAGIALQTYGDSHVNTKAGRKGSTADAFLLRLPLSSLDPAVALAAFAESLDLPVDLQTPIMAAANPEALFQAERRILEDHRIIPVAHVSEAVWLNSIVHNWQQQPDGEWKMDQVWVEK